ncbi:hypothetical protein ACIF8W_28740 [Streptomyces sp. NPDC085639]|uniref:hypothetical protein n=1 Tax=Streptomyces sp. NPDC085639 TaxID=3365734 RepID=UPI0037D3ACBF
MRIQIDERALTARTRGMILAATAVVIAATQIPASAQQPAPTFKPLAAISLGDSYISGEGGRWYGNANTADQEPGENNYSRDRAGTDRAFLPSGSESCDAVGSFFGSPQACYRPRNIYRDEYKTPWNPNSINHGVNEDTRKGTGCHRSDVSEIIGFANRQNTLPDGTLRALTDPAYLNPVNLACSGAETKHIIGGPVGDNKEANDRVDSEGQVIGFKGENLQISDLAEAVKRYQVRVVVLSIGGNDMGFGPVAEACGKEYVLSRDWKANCLDADMQSKLNQRLVTTKAAVKKTLHAIKNTMEAGGQTNYRVILQTYPQFLPLETTDPNRPGEYKTENRYPSPSLWQRLSRGGCPFGPSDSNGIRGYVSKLSTSLKEARDEVNANTGGVDVDFMDVQDAFHSHEICNVNSRLARESDRSASNRGADFEWLRYVDSGKPTARPQGDKDESVHPNAFGQVALGTCLHKTYNRGAGSYACKPAFYNAELTKTLGPEEAKVTPWVAENPG